jgi:hypothetical protein
MSKKPDILTINRIKSIRIINASKVAIFGVVKPIT